MSESLRFAPLLGRILIAILFVPAGFGKLTGFQGAVGYAESAGVPIPALCRCSVPSIPKAAPDVTSTCSILRAASSEEIAWSST